MAQHKWHKEIKAWADGEVVEDRVLYEGGYTNWQEVDDIPNWNDSWKEYRIKPQPKEPQCKKHKDAPHGFCRDASMSEDRYVCECEFWEEPKEPQYLYVYRLDNKTVIAEPNTHFECKSLDDIKFIGKIKLEDTDA